MGSSPQGIPFAVDNFPNLYSKNIQDITNEAYMHDKVLPRVEGKDYNQTSTNPAHEITLGYTEEK